MAKQPDIRYIRLYTDGNAARKVQPVSLKNTIRLPKVKRNKKLILRIDPVAVLSMAVAAVMMVLMVVGVVKLNAAQRQEAVMAEYVETLKTKNEFLENTYSSGYDIEEVEQLALALGMVPKEQVQKVTVSIAQDQEQAPMPDTWERFCIFLADLFA